MSSSKKTNPKKIPATLYDVERARREGRYEGFNGLLGVVLWELFEDFGFSDDDLMKMQQGIMFYCMEIKDGRLKLNDILSALKEEHNITIELNERK